MKNKCCRLTLICGLALLTSPLIGNGFEAFTEPVHSIDASAADMGRVAEVKVTRGDCVRRGDVLIVLDSQVWEASRRVVEKKATRSAAIKALEVEYELKHNRYVQLRELLDDGAGSPEEMRRAEADAEVARLNVEAAREEQDLARLQLAEIEARIEQRLVRSPIDGIVTDVLKETGEHVSTDSHVVTVVRLDRLRATFYLPTETAGSLSVGNNIPLEVSGSRHPAIGAIQYIAPVTEADSGRVRVDVLIDNVNLEFRSGVRCTMDSSCHAARDEF
jgi:RND family efflux transporter MFP subunit